MTSHYEGNCPSRAWRKISLRTALILLDEFATCWPVRVMDHTTANAREALFREVLAGRTPSYERLAALARILGITAQALLLDLLVEAKGVG